MGSEKICVIEHNRWCLEREGETGDLGFRWLLVQIMVVGHATRQTSAVSRPEHAALPRHATSTWMADASITAVEPSLDSVRLRRFFAVVAVASQAAIPSHALTALTALLVRGDVVMWVGLVRRRCDVDGLAAPRYWYEETL